MFWSRGSREAHEEYERPLHEEFGFTIARRGYDRDQVDAYITRLRGGTPPPEVAAFELVRRGYERSRVDEVITRLHREADREK
ncbi:DivIVA domain-containing protein [Streptomyces sp. AC154]|uniref:DivIVA domain-containing protein n=1 Tax=Streptomyces sp. AC154 TaxID=3143184 RepID=UPI003F81C081